MANEQNLVPNSQRSPNKLRENGKKGGRASGAARRRRKTMKEDLKALLAGKTKREDGTESTMQQDITLALLEAALKGDVKAYLAIRDTIGEKPAEKVEASVSRKSAPVIIFDIPKPDDVPEQVPEA